MRKFFALVVLVFFTFSLYSQKNVTFKGVELSCDINDVSAKLESLGFTPIIENERYKGQYAGFPCEVYLREFDSDYSSCELVIGLFNWESCSSKEIKLRYDYFKLDLEKDFGKGHYEENYYSLSGKCDYATIYDYHEGFTDGTIVLSVLSILDKDYYLELIYKINK